jgi:hypothetical protein
MFGIDKHMPFLAGPFKVHGCGMRNLFSARPGVLSTVRAERFVFVHSFVLYLDPIFVICVFEYNLSRLLAGRPKTSVYEVSRIVCSARGLFGGGLGPVAWQRSDSIMSEIDVVNATLVWAQWLTSCSPNFQSKFCRQVREANERVRAHLEDCS